MSSNHNHGSHMKMMAICCGLPIAIIAGAAILGFSLAALEPLILLLCPVMMIAMMFSMHKSQNKECSSSDVDKTAENLAAAQKESALQNDKSGNQ